MDVALEMIDRYKWLANFARQHLPIRQADKKRAHESRSVRYTDGVNIRKSKLSLREGFTNHRNDLTQVLARSQSRHNAAVLAMNVHLRSNDAGQDLPAIGYDSSRGLITGGLNAKDTRGHKCFSARLRKPMLAQG